jgi:hypothetical protein
VTSIIESTSSVARTSAALNIGNKQPGRASADENHLIGKFAEIFYGSPQHLKIRVSRRLASICFKVFFNSFSAKFLPRACPSRRVSISARLS